MELGWIWKDAMNFDKVLSSLHEMEAEEEEEVYILSTSYSICKLFMGWLLGC